MYIRSIRHQYAGYGQTSTQQLLAHLDATYANILSADLQANDAKLHVPYDANHPVKNLFLQVEMPLNMQQPATRRILWSKSSPYIFS